MSSKPNRQRRIPDSLIHRDDDQCLDAGTPGHDVHQAAGLAGSIACRALDHDMFADGVEKVGSSLLGYGSQVEEDGSLLDARDDRRIALPQGLRPRPLPNRGEPETGARRARPPKESAGPARFRRPGTTRPAPPRHSGPARREDRRQLPARDSSSSQGDRDHRQRGSGPARSASRIGRSVASSAASVILSSRRARMSGSASTRPIAFSVPTRIPH